MRAFAALASLCGLAAAAAVMAGCNSSGGSGPGDVSPATGHTTSSAGGTGSDNGKMSTYTVSATVTGLTGEGLVLELNGGQHQAVFADGTVTFQSGLMTGASYTVTVSTQPAVRREICGVTNGSGTIGQANVTDVAINCSIVLGFLYEATFSNQLFSFGISAGTGVPVPVGTPLATGTNPLALVAAPGGNFLYLDIPGCNEAPGSIAVYALNLDTGVPTAASSVVTSGLCPTRMVMSPGGGTLFVLGQQEPPTSVSAATVLATYAVNAATGALTPRDSSLTIGPVWVPTLAVTPDGKFLYVLTDGSTSNPPSPITLTPYAIGANGTLTAGPALTLPNNSSDAIAIDPLGRFLYLSSEQGDSNYAAATVLPYAINADSGALTRIGSGTPVLSNAGKMTVDPTGRYLYVLNNLNSDAANDTVLAMAIDQSTGVVSPLGSPLETAGAPEEIMCDPSGRFVYVGADSFTAILASFSISTAPSTAGQLVPSGGSGPAGEAMALAIVE